MTGPAPGAIHVTARAKLNLGLIVGPRRPDGFHEIATVFQSISLADRLEITPRSRGFSLSVTHEDAAVAGRTRPEPIPSGQENLVLRAARLLRSRAGLRGGAHFHLRKRIPVGAGLGGGSVDAAAALAGLSRLHGLRLGRLQRLEIAAGLGSDVPFLLTGGTALGLGRGERLTRLRLAKPFRAIVVVPRWRVSTARAYARVDRVNYGLTGWQAKLRSAQSLGRKKVTAIQALKLGNTFESALGERRAAYRSLLGRLRAAGLGNLRMTGSGSAVFGILRPGESVGSVLRRFRGDERIFVVDSARSSLRTVARARASDARSRRASGRHQGRVRG